MGTFILFLFYIFFARSSFILIIFHFGRLPFRLSSFLVVFHFGCFPFWSSSNLVVLHFGHPPFRSSTHTSPFAGFFYHYCFGVHPYSHLSRIFLLLLFSLGPTILSP